MKPSTTLTPTQLYDVPAPKLHIRLVDVVLGNWQARTTQNWRKSRQSPRAKRDSDAAAQVLLKAVEHGVKV